MTEKKNSPNTTVFKGFVTREDRESLHKHRGIAVWFTGLPASGKSTIAHHVEIELYQQGVSTLVLDGDNVRHGLCSDLGFSPEDRSENLRRIGEMLRLFVDAGLVVLTAFVSPIAKDRARLKESFHEGDFIEVFVDCPVEVCEERDEKGNYKKARAGIIQHYTGVSAPYERPQSPDLLIRSDEESIEEAVEKVLKHLAAQGVIP